MTAGGLTLGRAVMVIRWEVSPPRRVSSDSVGRQCVSLSVPYSRYEQVR